MSRNKNQTPPKQLPDRQPIEKFPAKSPPGGEHGYIPPKPAPIKQPAQQPDKKK